GETVAVCSCRLTATLSPAGVLGKCTSANAGASFTINARNATWTTNPNSKTYGNPDPSPLTTGSGDFLLADGVSATYSRATGETEIGRASRREATQSSAGVLAY